MAVPFFVPNNENGSSTAAQQNSTSNPNSASNPTSRENINISATINNDTRQNDPLLGALAEALYRVLLARQNQVGGNYYLNLPPPPSPTCSPHLPNYNPNGQQNNFAEVFFPNTGILPLDTSQVSPGGNLSPNSTLSYYNQLNSSINQSANDQMLPLDVSGHSYAHNAVILHQHVAEASEPRSPGAHQVDSSSVGNQTIDVDGSFERNPPRIPFRRSNTTSDIHSGSNRRSVGTNFDQNIGGSFEEPTPTFSGSTPNISIQTKHSKPRYQHHQSGSSDSNTPSPSPRKNLLQKHVSPELTYEEFSQDVSREYYDRLKIFEGQVPVSRKKKMRKNNVTAQKEFEDGDIDLGGHQDSDNNRENLTWPFLTAVLVAVGCGILKATR